MNESALDRPVWNMLNGPQSALATVSGAAVRLDPRYGPFAAACDSGNEAQAALSSLLTGPQDLVWVVEPEPWEPPPGTQVVKSAQLVQLVARQPADLQMGDEIAQRLGDSDAAMMKALALATEPGPWGELTRQFGSFFGIKQKGHLRAMAGERMRPAAGMSEVSGVCTWPDHRGKGYAALLIRRVMAELIERGDTPFLHSYAHNDSAIRLYRSLGFEIRRELTVTVLAQS